MFTYLGYFDMLNSILYKKGALKSPLHEISRKLAHAITK